MTPEPDHVTVRTWAGDVTELAQAADLYAAVFAEAPYDEDPAASRASFLARLDTYGRTKPDFRLVLATHDDEIAGLALGSGISAGDWWRDRIAPQLSPATAATWFGESAFAVVELATAPQHRRAGVAGSLLRALTHDLPYPTAVLTAYAEATRARKFYVRHGWTEVATGLHLGESPELCLYGVRLSTAQRE